MQSPAAGYGTVAGRSLYNKFEGIILGVKDGRSVWLTKLPSWRADYLEILGALEKCLELDMDGFAVSDNRFTNPINTKIRTEEEEEDDDDDDDDDKEKKKW